MKIRLLVIVLFALPTLFFGQKKYKYHYPIRLKSIPSTYTIDTTINLKNNSSINLYLIEGAKDTIPFIFAKISSSRKDTLLKSNMDGQISLSFLTDTSSIQISHPYYTPIDIKNILPLKGKEFRIDVHLGRSNWNAIGRIESKRKLSSIEIEQVIDDLSNSRTNNLILDKTIFVMWEI
jgi:hypothetical protein